MFTLDIADTCTRCGACVADCPGSVLTMAEDAKPIAAEPDNCIDCQHCMAICPVAALTINGVGPADAQAFTSADLPSAEKLDLLLRARRSCRHYEDEPVSRELIAELLATTAHAPTGCNRQGLSFHVISGADRMKTFTDDAMAGLVALANQDKLPPTMELFRGIAERWTTTGQSRIFRGAPHLLVVSAAADTPCAQEDPAIALSYFELLAQTHGLGTTWCGLAKVLLELLPGFKQTLGIPDDASYYYPMLFGWPARSYPRTVQRRSAATIVEID